MDPPNNRDSSKVDWDNPEAQVVDGFTVAEITLMVTDSTVEARCLDCGAAHTVEPDAENYDCRDCEAEGTVTSPLIKIGFI